MMFDGTLKGPGCTKCPVNGFYCDAQYRGSRCSNLRAKAGADFDPKTNADRIAHMSKDDLRDALIDYFCTWADVGDSYIFDLTRVKESRVIGTMSLDDFEEWGEDRVSEMVDDFLDWLFSAAEESHDL